jgi:hypothetical protein
MPVVVSEVRYRDNLIVYTGGSRKSSLSSAMTGPVPLKQGWNLVSSPLVPDPALNTSTFRGTNVTMVARYNRSTGGFDIYRVGRTTVPFPV